MTTETDDLGGFVVRVYECADPDCPPNWRFVAHCAAPVDKPKPHMSTMPATVYASTEAAAFSKTTNSIATPSLRANARARSTETPTVT